MRHESRRLSVRTALLLAGVAPLFAAAPAYAQDASGTPVPVSPQPPASSVPTSSDAATPPSQGGLEDIVVTARKRVESVQDVPVAVTAVSAETIRKQDLTSIEKIAARTPSLEVGQASNGSGAQITLRGIGSLPTSIGVEQSVAVVVDGAYYGQGRIIQEGFFDLARAEVLKGPQALFFGKNATAGVISLTTADPTDKTELHARTSYEFNAQQVQAELVGSTPLTDTLGIRVAVRGSKMFQGYYKNVAGPVSYNTFDIATGMLNDHTAEPAPRNEPKERELLGRITLKWTPTNQITDTLKLSGDYDHINNTSFNYDIYRCASGFSSLNPIYPCGYSFTIRQNNLPTDIAKNFPYAGNSGLYDRYKSYSVNNTFNYKLDNVTLTNVTNYNWNNNRWECACDFQSSDTGTWATENSTWHAFSSEFRALTTFDSPINVMVGGLYQRTKRDFDQWIAFANIEDSSQSPEDRYIATSKTSFTKGETLAGFGQVTWKVLPRVEIAGGVRYTHETKDSFFTQPYNNAAVTGIFRPEDDPDGLGIVNAHQKFTNWSPEATISWKPIRDILLYAAYKTAYKSGGFSNGGINSKFSLDPKDDLTFNPERARGFEAGIKTTLANNQLRLNLDAYTFGYHDYQVDFFNSPIFAFQTLTAQARTKGVELEAEYAPRAVPGLNLHGSINYNRARYTDFIGPCVAGETPDQGCNLQYSALQNGGTGGFTRQDLSGSPLSMAPKWTGALGASYDSEFGNGMHWGLSVDGRYTSSYLLSGFGDFQSKQPNYATLDATARIGGANDRWEVAVIGKNLTNRIYLTGGNDSPSTGGGTGTPAGVRADQNGYLNPGRTVQVQLSVNF